MTSACGSLIEQRKRRWRDFLDTTRPPQHLFVIALDCDAPRRPWPWPDNVPDRIDHAWGVYLRQMEQMEWLDDDALPYLDPYTGTEIFAEAFGCDIYRPPNEMPSARPLIHSASQVDRLRVPAIDCPALARLFHIADELRRRAGNAALLKLVDIQSPMDIAALIWDKNDFYVAAAETPQAVLQLAAKARELLAAFLDEWFARYGREFIAHYPAYYMPCGITLSEDEVGAVSEQMCRELFLPELAELSHRYGGIGVHCCANARHQWGNFKRIPALRLLNLVQPPEELRAAYAFFATHTAQMHSWCGDGPPWRWPLDYPEGARVVLQARAATRQEAQRMCEKLKAACGRA